MTKEGNVFRAHKSRNGKIDRMTAVVCTGDQACYGGWAGRIL